MTPPPYFDLKNSHGLAKEFLQNLELTWVCALKTVWQPWYRSIEN